VHHTRYVESDILKYIDFNLQFDYVETILKNRIISNKRNKRIYNYMEYLVHAPPGDYEAVLVFKSPEGISAISTQLTVYSRGTARYFIYNTIESDKKLVMVFLKSLSK